MKISIMPVQFRTFVTGALLILGIVLHGCNGDLDLVKNGIVSVGNNLYLVVDSDWNELDVGTNQPGDLLPSHKTYRGKPRSEDEVVLFDKSTTAITSLEKLKKPVPGTVIIEFRSQYIKVHEGDGDREVTKHRRRQKAP